MKPPTREPVAVGRSLEAARRLCEALAGVVDLPLAVQLWDGSMVPLGSGAPPDRFVAIRGPGVLGALLRRPSLDTLFRHYVRGDVEPHGTDLITLFGIVQDARKQGRLRLGGLRRRFPWGALPPLLLACEARPEIRQEFEGGKAVHQRKGRRAEELIQFHYDASNEFYALFLDEGMVYSCGYFTAWENSINEAQRDKLELICRKLRLRPGEALLDIGCGWGALVCHAARHHGVHAHGVTLSEAQCAYAQEKVARLGLADRVRVELRDYRSLEGRYDKIASVGMYEHVGIDSYPAYFRKVHKLLNDGGVFLNHGITRRAKRDERALRRASASRRVILKYIFPGAELDHVGHTLQVMENCGFEVHDVEGLRRHYARTCRLWHDRLAARREAAVPLVGPERYRMWAAYLAGVAIGFERGPLRLFQTVATKQGDAEGLPPTRADLYRRAGASGNLGARQPT
ncbi:MAG TPA: cyclopropane-fatty-acyl-phospholipid synthase family protein [Geminicoccaceae bacterium]|jgi:cyclopropane-fatty-acyl-phospholipid synthase|nr:cyclopropane-fatty-acyl-phospholipid synthase family protein [Geminicoccaceae bacterium]